MDASIMHKLAQSERETHTHTFIQFTQIIFAPSMTMIIRSANLHLRKARGFDCLRRDISFSVLRIVVVIVVTAVVNVTTVLL